MKTKLPVRLPMDAEVELMDRFMHDHGDDLQEWSQATVLEYAAKVAELRAQQLNTEGTAC